MAVMTGAIKNVSVDDGQVRAYCETGHGPAFTAIIPQLGGDFHPIPGDVVTASKIGQEWIAFSVCCKDAEAGAGEHLLFSRDAAGEVVATIHAKADGTVEIRPTTTCSIGDGTDYVSMAQKVDLLWTTLWGVFSGWTPVPQDGGAALRVAFMAAFPQTPQSTASTNLKAE